MKLCKNMSAMHSYQETPQITLRNVFFSNGFIPWQIPPGSPQDSLASVVIPISKYSARNMLKHTTGCPTGSRGGPGMHSGLRYKWSQKCKCCQVSQMAHLFIWVSFSYTMYRLLPHSSRHDPLQPHLWRGCETPCLSS